MRQEELNAILKKHKNWLNGKGGTRADLRDTDLRNANLQDVDLQWANLQCANLQNANLRNAVLRFANLEYANLQGAVLQGADLQYADLQGTKGCCIICPEEGSFIGFKKCRSNKIVELEILEDSKRSNATNRKCRCDKAKVLSITSFDGLQEFESTTSSYDSRFIYNVGEIVSVENFDDNRWNECATGIHFFITRQEAIKF